MPAFKTLAVILKLCTTTELIVALLLQRVTIRRLAFWWRSAGVFMSSLMEFSGYPNNLQAEYLIFFLSYVVPRLGPTPSEFKNQAPCSYMSDDCTPIEFSWAWSSKNGETVRSTFEPLCSATGLPTSSRIWMDDLSKMAGACKAAHFDLSWAQICFDSIIYKGKSPSGLNSHGSQFSIGFDLTRHGIIGKAYFLTHITSLMSSSSPADTATHCLKSLGLTSQWDFVLTGVDHLPQDFIATPEIIAVDLVSPSQNRAKVYFRTNACSLKAILQLFNLGGTLSSHQVTEASDYIRRLWPYLFGDVSESSEVMSQNPCHYASGFVVYFDLRLSESRPNPKLYIPVRHYCETDQSITASLSRFFRENGDVALSEQYTSYIETLSHRPLDQQTGIQTYFGIGCGKDGPKSTIYLCPEVFTSIRSLR